MKEVWTRTMIGIWHWRTLREGGREGCILIWYGMSRCFLPGKKKGNSIDEGRNFRSRQGR